MKPEHFETYRKFLKDKSGIIITTDKIYLLESRLMPVAKQHGFEDIHAMADGLARAPSPAMMDDIIDAMTTNETSFFRDKSPFENFSNVCIPYFLETKKILKSLKIWCAASSSGQEPYSLRMVLNEHPEMSKWNVEIKGTDLSNDILEQAKSGIYSQFEVQRGLPIQLLMKYFTQDEQNWLIKDEIKESVKFSKLNLLDSFMTMGKSDLIFCRNVLIYFDEETKADILKRLAAQLEPDGYLFLGGAETVLGITEEFVPLKSTRGLYVRKDSPHLEQQDAPPATTPQQPLAS